MQLSLPLLLALSRLGLISPRQLDRVAGGGTRRKTKRGAHHEVNPPGSKHVRIFGAARVGRGAE